MSIPGLFHLPAEESSNSASAPAIEFVSFNSRSFSVPSSHRFGNCRPVTDFDKICLIGEGGYGKVYKVRDQKSNEIFALKKLKIDRNSLMPQNYLREINNLKLLKHENIANLICVAAGKSFESTYLILEYCEYALSEVIDDNQLVFSQPQVKNIMYQLLTGLDFIHKQLIFHRDITPANIMFSSSGILKIIDFGLSRKISSGKITPQMGLHWYRAPEVLFGSENYTSAVDIWSAGCIFAEMICKEGLFAGNSDCEVITKIIDLLGTPTENIWPGFSRLPLLRDYRLKLKPYNRIRTTFVKESSATVSLLQNTLLYYPLQRFSAQECLQHEYFSELPLACTREDLQQILKASKAI